MSQTARTRPPLDEPRPAPARGDHARTVALVVGLVALTASAVIAYEPLGPRALIDDLGIQFHLSEQTAHGAIPLIDFEHGWNAGAWYYGALLYWLAGGNPDAWAFLWWHLTGSFLAGVCVLLAGWRTRLGAGWLVALVVATFAVTSVVHAKYAVPAAWFVLLVPVARQRSLPWALGLRAGLAGVTAFAHLELAVLLGAGLGMYELFGARDGDPRERLMRALAAPVGVIVALAGQTLAYATLGLGPGELFGQLLGQAEVDPAFHFGYLLLQPGDVRMWLFPTSLIVAFVPVVWRRLSGPTRLAACLHLALALVALRRTDPSHVAAATTLLAALLVFGVRDLARSSRPVLDASPGRAIVSVAAGAAWFGAAILVGFRYDSLLAIVGLAVVALAGVAASRTGDHPWASAGALLAGGALLLGGLLGGGTAMLTSAEPLPEAEGAPLTAAVAAAVHDPLRDCVGDERRVWVVPYPLGLYRELDLTNPTPFVMFWYPFRGEHDRVRALIDDGDIPAILEFNRWPLTFDRGLAEFVEARYELCAEVEVPATGDVVRVWTYRDG